MFTTSWKSIAGSLAFFSASSARARACSFVRVTASGAPLAPLYEMRTCCAVIHSPAGVFFFGGGAIDAEGNAASADAETAAAAEADAAACCCICLYLSSHAEALATTSAMKRTFFMRASYPVSYTHLTLPTSDLV